MLHIRTSKMGGLPDHTSVNLKPTWLLHTQALNHLQSLRYDKVT